MTIFSRAYENVSIFVDYHVQFETVSFNISTHILAMHQHC